MRKMIFILFVFISSFIQASEISQEKLWSLLKQDNHFAMIRHALAPGVGDPTNFNVNIKSTQRNLNNTGKQQAKDIGTLFRKNGIHQAQIYSSYWFRCYETAILLNLGDVIKFEGLNSFFEDYYDEKITSNLLKDFLYKKKINKPLILVTHQVNITNLTAYYPDSGEIIVIKRQKNNTFKVVGTIPTL